MRINVHVHIHEYGKDFTEEFGRAMEVLFAGEKSWRTGKPWQVREWVVDVKTLIEDMDRGGVDQSWISSWVMKPLNIYNERSSEFMCDLRDKYPDRLVPMISVDPLGGLQSARHIERSVREFGMQAVGEFLPGYNYVEMQDHRLYPIYEICEEFGLPILIHTGRTAIQGGRSFEMTHPSLLEHVLFDFPKLKLILAHSGSVWSKEALVVMMKYAQVCGDIAWWQIFPFHSLAEFLVWAKKMNCIDRILWGTDYPYYDFASDIETLRRIPRYTTDHGMEPSITEKDIDAVLGINAARLIAPAKTTKK